MKYVCLGNSVYDTTVITEKFPLENMKQESLELVECGGGNAANCAYLLASWKCNTDLISIIGDDYYGRKIMQEYYNVGINSTYIEIDPNYETRRSYIIANKKNNTRTIISSPRGKQRKLRIIPANNYDYILIDGNYIDTAKELLSKNKDATIIFDLEKNIKEIVELAKNATYIICSEDFAEDFTKLSLKKHDIATLKECHKKLEDYFRIPNIIITLGKCGSFTKIDKYKLIPTVKVASVDTTGAGDVFHAAFAYFISQKYDIEKAIKYSSIASALSTTKVGCRYKMPSLKEVLEYDQLI